jgi:hypothetical protein
VLREALCFTIIKVLPHILLKDITFILSLAFTLTGLELSLVNAIRIKAIIGAVA